MPPDSSCIPVLCHSGTCSTGMTIPPPIPLECNTHRNGNIGRALCHIFIPPDSAGMPGFHWIPAGMGGAVRRPPNVLPCIVPITKECYKMWQTENIHLYILILHYISKLGNHCGLIVFFQQQC